MADELLDVLDADGRPLGFTKPRSAVHRNGDWHAAFHLWVASPRGVLLQRRAQTKGSWPGRLDATAAGHLTAGEQVSDGLREAEEELGVSFRFADLVPLGTYRVDDPRPDGGRNRELQHVFHVGDDRPLDQWTKFDRAELDGLVLVPLDGFAALASGAGPVTAAFWNGKAVQTVEVAAGELVPAPYLRELAATLLAQHI